MGWAEPVSQQDGVSALCSAAFCLRGEKDGRIFLLYKLLGWKQSAQEKAGRN